MAGSPPADSLLARSAVPLKIAVSALVALATTCLVYIVLTRPVAPEGALAAQKDNAQASLPGAEAPTVGAAPPALPALSRAAALVQPAPAPWTAVSGPPAPAPSAPSRPSALPASPVRAEPPGPPAPTPSELALQKPASAAPALRAVSSLPRLVPGGAHRYTLVNLHPDKRRLFDVNYQESGFIPLCTPVRIDAQDEKVVRFTVLATGQQYEYLHHHVIPDFQANVDRVFGYSCLRRRAHALSSLDQDGIREGRVLPGMTKEGVILAIGYPPEHATPSTKSNDWRYWTGRFSTMVVQFQNDRVSNIKK